MFTPLTLPLSQRPTTQSTISDPVSSAIASVGRFERIADDIGRLPDGPKRKSAEARAEAYLLLMQRQVKDSVVRQVIYSNRPTQIRVSFLTYFASQRLHTLGLSFYGGLLRSDDKRIRSHVAFILETLIKKGALSATEPQLHQALRQNFDCDRDELKHVVFEISKTAPSEDMVAILRNIGVNDRVRFSDEAIRILGIVRTSSSRAALNDIQQSFLERAREAQDLAHGK